MTTLNWPGFGLASISPTLDQPSQSNSSAWTGTRTVVTDPWHGKWSFKVTLATRQGDAAFQAARAFFTSLKGQIGTFHLPAVEAPQNGNTGVTLASNAAQGAVSLALTGLTDALGAGNMVTIAGQLLSLTTVGSLVAGAQTVNFMPALRAAATSGASVETAKPYALVYLSDSSFTWDIGSWRRYGLSFSATEAVGETDGASPSGDVWDAAFTSTPSVPVGALAIGLFVAAAALLIPVGTDLVQTSGHSEIDKGHAMYVADGDVDSTYVSTWPDASFISANGRGFRLSHFQLLGPYEFGCPDSNDGTLRDAGPKMQAMHDYLHAFAVNQSSGGGFYQGVAPINWPHAHFHSAATTLEPQSTIAWLGAGSGLNGPSGGAGTLLTFGTNTTGVRLLFPNSTGDTGTTATHDGCASFYARGMCWQSTFDLTAANESEHHGFVPRAPYFLEDIYIKNFPGAGFIARAGLVGELSANISGNVSCSRAINVKVEGCRDGFWISGGDANIMHFGGCWAYQNTRYGYRTESGAGSNLITGLHCASNGLISNVGKYTQCSRAGERYALAEGGNPLNAPSGTTADTVDWMHIEAGGAIANLIPTWAATPGLFRNGGDMVGIAADASRFLEDYSETGGFNQFTLSNFIDGGTLSDAYYRGGTRVNTSSSYGFRIVQSPNAVLTLQHRSTQGAIYIYDELGVQHSAIEFSKSAGNYYYARDATGHNFYTKPYGGSATLRGRITTDGLELPSGGIVTINGQQVVGARGSAIAALTVTATTGSLPVANGSITIANAATPTNAELLEYCRELESKLETLLSRFRAATGNGAIA